jgi:hypothetical protein
MVIRGQNGRENTFRSSNQVGCPWLTPAMLTNWEAEIRRILVPGK